MASRLRVMIAGCGYIGCAAAEQLRNQGHQVFGARRNVAQLPQGIEPVAMDLLAGDYEALPVNLDALVWALAPTPDEHGYRTAYVDAPAALLRHLQKRGDPVARAILVASTSVWHRNDGKDVDESSPPTPRDFRGQLVLAGEKVFENCEFPTTCLRLAGIYGPGRRRLLDRISCGQAAPPAYPTYGNRIWRDDAAAAIAHVLQLPDPASTYAVVDDDPADLRDVYGWIAQQMGVQLPASSRAFHARGGSKRIQNRLLRATGWRPNVPDFRVGYAQLLRAR